MSEDIWIKRLTLGGVAAVALLVIIAAVAISVKSGKISEGVLAIGTTALGALIGILKPSV